MAISQKIKALINNRIILIILAFLITALIFLLLFSSCSSTKKPQPEFSESNYFQGFVANDPSDANTSSFTESLSSESTSVSQPFDESDSISEPAQEPNAYTKMLSGDIYVDKNSSKTEDLTLRPFFNFWINNFSDEQTEPQNIKLLGSIKYDEYNSYILYYACYSYKVQSEENHVALVYASLKSNPNRYILVDAKNIADESYNMYSEKIYGLIMRHKSLNIYKKEQPIVSLQNGFNIIDLQSIIGKDKQIYESVSIKKDIVAVLSSDSDNKIRFDLFDIATGKLTGSHFLSPFKRNNVAFDHTYQKSESDFYFYFYFINNEDAIYDVIYNVVIGDNGNITDTLTIISYDDIYDYYDKDKIEHLCSESGRYEAYYKNSNLYVIDTNTNKSTLVYELSEKDSDASNVEYNFFDGDILYYATYNAEGDTEGLGRYNPITKENVYNRDVDYNWLFIKDEYVYACDEMIYSQGPLFKFKKNDFKAGSTITPINKVDTSYTGFSYYDFSKNRKFIAKVTLDVQYDSVYLQTDKSEIALYDTDSLTQLKALSLPVFSNSANRWRTDFTDNYCVLSIDAAVIYVFPLN